MKRSARYFLLIAICILMCCQTGCGLNGHSRKTTVTFLTWNPADTGPDSPIHKIIEDFENENPDIDIKYICEGSGDYQNHLRVELMEGKRPDVFGIPSGSDFDSTRSFEEELTPYCEESWGPKWKDKFFESCIENVSDNKGNIYGLPLGQTYAGYLWADVNMLKEYGCEVPRSYKEMQEVCQKLREKDQYPLAIGAKDIWLDFDMWMSIAADCDKDALYNAIEGNASFESEPIIESFRIWQDSFSNGVFQDKAVKMTLYDTVNDMFQRQGSIPMFANGSWAMNMYTISDEKTQENFNSPGADHEVFLIDWNDDGKVAPVTASVDVILCLNPESKNKEAAFRWMNYLVSEGQELLVNQYLEYMPSRADMELNVHGLNSDGQKNLEYIIDNGRKNVAGSRIIQYEDLNIAVCKALEDLAYGHVTPEEAAARIQEVSHSTIR